MTEAAAVVSNEASSENKSVEAAENLSVPVLVWSEVLASPSVGDTYSPAREIGDKSCLHGAGLQKALDHGKSTARSGRRVAAMLLESASCYEQFGVSLMKACQSNPLEGDAFKSILSLSEQTRQLAMLLREEIAMPLQGYHTAVGDTIPVISRKYEESRRPAYEARQRALVARNKYLLAVEAAEQACSEVQQALASPDREEAKESKEEEQEGTNSQETAKLEWQRQLEQYGKINGPEAMDRVTHQLNDVIALQKRYQSLVQKENAAVQFSQTSESIALESLQKIQEQRLCTFFDALVRTFRIIKDALDKLIISAEESSSFDESSNKQLRVVQKKGEFFSAFLKGGALLQEKTGVADADSLGLDEDVGKLRDEMKTRIAQRLARIKKVKVLAAFFDDVSSAAAKLGNDLQKVAKHEDSFVSSKGTPVEHLRTLMSNCEGPRTLRLWADFIKCLEREAESSHQFARVLKSIKASKLDNFLATSEKQCKEVAEQDDTRWKQLCEAARTAMRADAKYKHNTAQTAKARERVRSVDMDSTSVERSGAKSPLKGSRAMDGMKDGMNKAFGNFLSILPDGGEGAMQILTPDARRAVAERAAKEADEKEMRGRQALDNAVTYKSKAQASYKSKTQALAKQYELEEMSGVEDIQAAIEGLCGCLKTLQISRYTSLECLSELGEQPLEAALIDLDDWVKETSLANNNAVSKQSDSSPTGGFMLSVVLADSESAKRVQTFAQIGTTDSFEEESEDDASDGGDLRVASQDSNRSLEVKNDDDLTKADSGTGQQGKKWLQKSFSTPMGKPGFKKFRKFHSLGEPEKEIGENADVDMADDLTESSTISTTIGPQNSKESLEANTFLAFWPDFEGPPPGVTHSFTCVFLPKDCTKRTIGSVEFGRLFLTHRGAVFVAWRGKKSAIVQYSAMTGLAKQDNLFRPAVGDTMLVTAQNGASLLLGNFVHRDMALDIIEGRIAEAKKSRAEAEAAKKVEATKEGVSEDKEPSSAVPVAADPTLAKMETVLNKKIRGVAVNKFHEIVWSDTSDNKSLYGSWLGSGNCYDIVVGQWETSGDAFTSPWSGERFSQKRSVSFQLKRNSMIGPPVAGVNQTQYCRLDNNDRSTMHMTVEFQGIPYADTFQVEVRWVATRSGTRDLTVQVGVFVEFKKSTLLKSQIRNGTLSETKPVHENLFAFVKEALSKEIAADDAGGDDEVENEDDNVECEEKASEGGLLATIKNVVPEFLADNMHIVAPAAGVIVVGLLWCLPSLLSPSNPEVAQLHAQMNSMQAEMKQMREAIQELTAAIKQQQGNN
ncbi:GRAM [Seminavis robusta]|uniref:GRAM n=1 Tax=Seminavis robusta TaxID=568900 RepID=A0A9N8HCT2_9STRA|nr:GRAM [Seminavis robusta]|eukprot:Sro394_g133800.1 GRAM (1297) ;mRNA; r:18592-22762